MIRAPFFFFLVWSITSVLPLHIFLIAHNFLSAGMDCLIHERKKENNQAVSLGELLWIFFKCTLYQAPVCHKQNLNSAVPSGNKYYENVLIFKFPQILYLNY